MSFEFNYIEISTGEIGFHDPVQGAEFRLALESAANRFGSQLQHDAVIQMNVFSYPFTGSALSVAASASTPSLTEGGFGNRVIPDKILGKPDPNGSDADGILRVFFFDEDDDFVYDTDPTDGIEDRQLDFQSVMTHEMVHLVGWTSSTNIDGSDDQGNGIDSPGTWTRFDRFLSDANGNRLIDADPDSDTAFQMNTSIGGWPTVSVGGQGPDGGLFFSGPIATSVYGGLVPLYSPSVYSLASTASHLDSEGFPGPSVFSPLEHLMSHATVRGEIPQTLTVLERAILADIGILMNSDDGFEFGDAPESYPVRLSDDGARHFPSDLRLGESLDLEPDGQPSSPADSDGEDDDGVFVVSDIVSLAETSATSSVTIESTDDAFINAWFDWNQDGDWNDDGEQVFRNRPVTAGMNHLSFHVPDGVTSGNAFARYRLSTQPNLTPSGLAGDGEVEDYQIDVLDGSANPSIDVNVVDAMATVQALDGNLQVSSDSVTSFSAPIDSIESIKIIGGQANDRILVVLDDLPTTAVPIALEGGGGTNTLAFKGGEPTFDLTNHPFNITAFTGLDLSGDESPVVALDANTVDAFSEGGQTLTVKLRQRDRLNLLDLGDWRLGDPLTVNSFLLTATHQENGQVIQVDADAPWQNFLRPSDVDNDGETNAIDALNIINELSRRAYSDPTTQTLVAPETIVNWPGRYLDQSGDNAVSALDALRVINELARQNRASGEAFPADIVFATGDFDDDSDHPAEQNLF
ncbi:MAG: GEVED domain-containing protein [Planctomycetota bacterium]